MKKKLKDTKLFGVLKGVVKTAGSLADTAFLGGAIGNIKEDMSKIGGEPSGTVDLGKLIKTIVASTIPVILLIALLAGWIDLETLKELLSLF